MNLIWEGVTGAVSLLIHADPETFRIVALSLLVSGLATLLATLLGVPLGAGIALHPFPGRALAVSTINAGMGLPPVVIGLLVSILLWRSGPFGFLGWIFTPISMVLAQLLVAMPIAAGLTRSSLGLLDEDLLQALRADGAGEWRVGWEAVRAARPEVLVAVAAAFGRAISEVGASLMVGGNILHYTRIMTTAITLDVQEGEFSRALALGLILLLLGFLVNAGLVRGARPLRGNMGS